MLTNTTTGPTRAA